MEFDIFFSISQTPDTTGFTPSEDEMFSNFFDQVELADDLGFGVGWVAQAQVSTEVQKMNNKPINYVLSLSNKITMAIKDCYDIVL